MKTVAVDLSSFARALAVTSSGRGESPATAPVAVTGIAQAGDWFAFLHGTVDPGGLETRAWFEWGPTPALGSSTTVQVVSAGAPDSGHRHDHRPPVIHDVLLPDGRGECLGDCSWRHRVVLDARHGGAPDVHRPSGRRSAADDCTHADPEGGVPRRPNSADAVPPQEGNRPLAGSSEWRQSVASGPRPARRQQRPALGREALDDPAAAVAPVAEPVVQAVVAVLPELVGLRDEPVAAPVRRARDVAPDARRRTRRSAARAPRATRSARSASRPRPRAAPREAASPSRRRTRPGRVFSTAPRPAPAGRACGRGSRRAGSRPARGPCGSRSS